MKMLEQLKNLIKDNEYKMTILANSSAFLNQCLENINWLGFYLNIEGNLILSSFQGKPACIKIPFNKGVCGYCARNQETIIVDDVHSFAGHIACDSASKSEICIPIILNGELYGLLDVDSPITARFSNNEKLFLEEAVKIITDALKNAK